MLASQRASDSNYYDVSHDVCCLPLTSTRGEGRTYVPPLSPSPCDPLVVTRQVPFPMALPARSYSRRQDDTPAWIFLAIKAWLVYMKIRDTPDETSPKTRPQQQSGIALAGAASRWRVAGHHGFWEPVAGHRVSGYVSP